MSVNSKNRIIRAVGAIVSFLIIIFLFILYIVICIFYAYFVTNSI